MATLPPAKGDKPKGTSQRGQAKGDKPKGTDLFIRSARMGGEGNDWLDIDPMYQALGDEETIRRHRYQTFLEEAIPPGEWELIREAVK